jgi:hypothetical protein
MDHRLFGPATAGPKVCDPFRLFYSESQFPFQFFNLSAQIQNDAERTLPDFAYAIQFANLADPVNRIIVKIWIFCFVASGRLDQPDPAIVPD